MFLPPFLSIDLGGQSVIIHPMDGEGFLNEPIAEVQIKPWHILALLGGGIAAYLLLRKKDEPAVPAPAPSPKTETKAPETSGFGDCTLLGEQSEPLYDGAPLVGKVRQYTEQGWIVFKLPTGYENVMMNRQRYPVHKIYAAPPGRRIPAQAVRVSI